MMTIIACLPILSYIVGLSRLFVLKKFTAERAVRSINIHPGTVQESAAMRAANEYKEYDQLYNERRKSQQDEPAAFGEHV